MPSMTVTATQGGTTSGGMGLRVFVLTGASPVASQTGGSNTIGSNSTNQSISITTTQTGSRVYGSSEIEGGATNGTVTATGSATLVDNFLDSTDTDTYVTYEGTSVTGTPGPTSFGVTYTGTLTWVNLVGLEILTTGTLAEDGSSPAFVNATTTTVTTASFTPPPGSLLVALIASNGGSGVETMTVTDNLGTHLNWTEQVKINNSGHDYAGVWIADVPAAGGVPLQQKKRYQRHGHRRRMPQQAFPLAAPPVYPVAISNGAVGSLVTSAPVQAGDGMFLVYGQGSGTFNTPSDGTANTWVTLPGSATGSGSFIASATYAGSPGTPTVAVPAGTTITWGTSTGAAILLGVRGVAPQGYDISPTATSGTSLSPAQTFPAQSQPGEIILAGINYANINANTWSPPMTKAAENLVSGNSVTAAWFVVPDGSSQSLAATLGSSSFWDLMSASFVMGAFIPAPASLPPQPAVLLRPRRPPRPRAITAAPPPQVAAAVPKIAPPSPPPHRLARRPAARISAAPSAMQPPAVQPQPVRRPRPMRRRPPPTEVLPWPAIQVIQNGVTSLSATQAGNTVFMISTDYSNTGVAVTITATNPLVGGSLLPGAIKIMEVQSPWDAGNNETVHHAIWMAPNCPSIAGGLGVTLSAGFNNSLVAYEINGLGSFPRVDVSSQQTSPSGGSTGVTSGTTPPTNFANEFILAVAAIFQGDATGPGGAWNAVEFNVSGWQGYQVQTVKGQTYIWNQTTSFGQWSAGIVTVTPSMLLPAVPVPSPRRVPRPRRSLTPQLAQAQAAPSAPAAVPAVQQPPRRPRLRPRPIFSAAPAPGAVSQPVPVWQPQPPRRQKLWRRRPLTGPAPAPGAVSQPLPAPMTQLPVRQRPWRRRPLTPPAPAPGAVSQPLPAIEPQRPRRLAWRRPLRPQGVPVQQRPAAPVEAPRRLPWRRRPLPAPVAFTPPPVASGPLAPGLAPARRGQKRRPQAPAPSVPGATTTQAPAVPAPNTQVARRLRIALRRARVQSVPGPTVLPPVTAAPSAGVSRRAARVKRAEARNPVLGVPPPPPQPQRLRRATARRALRAAGSQLQQAPVPVPPPPQRQRPRRRPETAPRAVPTSLPSVVRAWLRRPVLRLLRRRSESPAPAPPPGFVQITVTDVGAAVDHAFVSPAFRWDGEPDVTKPRWLAVPADQQWLIDAARSRWHADTAGQWGADTVASRWGVEVAEFEPIAAISQESVPAVWTSNIGGVVTDPTTLPMVVEFAFPVSSGNPLAPAEPSTWYPASWVAGTTSRGFFAECPVGTGTTGPTLAAGKNYDVWSQVQAGPNNTVIKFVGVLPVY